MRSRLIVLTALTLASFTVAAADIRVSCEKRPGRSKISVDGNNLVPGQYRAIVSSGGVQVSSPVQNSVGDEAEFDFDSNRADIAQGATAIPAGYIVDGRVKAQIVNSAGQVVVSNGEVICRVRTR